MPSRSLASTACNHANAVNSQRHGHHRRVTNDSAAITVGTTTHAARRDGSNHYSCGKRYPHIGPARKQDGDYSYLADILQNRIA